MERNDPPDGRRETEPGSGVGLFHSEPSPEPVLRPVRKNPPERKTNPPVSNPVAGLLQFGEHSSQMSQRHSEPNHASGRPPVRRT